MCFEIQEFIWMRARIDSFEGIYCNKNFFRDVVAREAALLPPDSADED